LPKPKSVFKPRVLKALEVYLKKETLAVKIGCSYSTILRIVRDEKDPTQSAVVARITKFLDKKGF